jgi:hypothetical protein
LRSPESSPRSSSKRSSSWLDICRIILSFFSIRFLGLCSMSEANEVRVMKMKLQ